MDALTTTALTKRYGHRELPIQRLARRLGRQPSGDVLALDDLSISVTEGEIFGFLGPNGAGKSTMIRLLLGYLHPTAGSATVLGRDIVRDSVEIRRRVGYLPGGIALYDSLTGERLLDYLGELTGRPPTRRAELLDRLEMSARTMRRPVRDYSRGMRQKMGIIQALQHDPELAILDEPTEGLDPLMQRAFYGILDDLREAGRTIFFSSHVLSERNVELRVADGDLPRLEGVPGVSAIARTADGRLTCQLEGDVGPFLAALAGHSIVDLTIEPAHLEEAFLELYEDTEPDDGEPATAAASAGETGEAGEAVA